MSSTATTSFDTIRNGRVEDRTRLIESTDPRCNEMQDNATGNDEGLRLKDEAGTTLSLPALTARQLTAINLLTLGKSVMATGASIKVDPSTIHRWKSSNALFIAELNRRQHDAFDAIASQLRLTMLQAVGELHRLMSDGQKSEKREVMWKMLAFLRPQKLIEPTSPTDARDVIDAKIRDGRARRGEIVEAPIEEEDRIAWVNEQEDGSRGTGLRHVRNDATAETKRKAENAERSSEFAEREGHVPGARATEGASAQSRLAERSTGSDASERLEMGSSSNASGSAKTTPLPSREGLGEGARGDDGLDKDGSEMARTTPPSRSDAVEQASINPLATYVDQSQILHEYVQDDATRTGEFDEKAIASRPLPRPADEATPSALPQGEGSQEDLRSELSAERAEPPHPNPLPAVKASPTARIRGRGDQSASNSLEVNNHDSSTKENPS